MYLTYEQYAELGGSASEADFPALERRARYKLDYWTLDRLKAYESVPEQWAEAVAMAMTDIIDTLPNLGGERVTSFSNGVNSFGFADMSEEDELYFRVVEILPIDLVSGVVGHEG